MDLQEIKIYCINKIILCKPRPVMFFEIGNRRIQPDRFGQIKAAAHLIQRCKYFVRPCIRLFPADNHIPDQPVFLPDFCPHPKHGIPPALMAFYAPG
ncbi:MAG: hypothetical protein K2N94_13205 [Lachnospiraceae bacterium]|nr:hypothetical protein [Lachnospiraceae bacterium]